MSITPEWIQENFEIRQGSISGPKEHRKVWYAFFLEKRKTGYCTITANGGDLDWDQFYPLHKIPNKERHGIGTWAHILTLQAVIKEGQVDQDAFVKHWTTTGPRRRHLAYMNLYPSSSIPLHIYLSRSLDFADIKGFDTKPIRGELLDYWSPPSFFRTS